MPEPKEQSEDMQSPGARSDASPAAGSQLNPANSATGDLPLQPLLQSSIPKSSVPSWLRPFFSLRVQLTVVYSMILVLAVVVVCLLIYQQTSPLYVGIAAVSTVVGGTVIALIFTSLLLRPLWRVTDAAQAIAIGDLQQRERLPLRLPPQDEIDRLAGSLHEMVTRLEHAEEMQHAAEQRFQRFFSDASHQLRTPLTSIRGFTEVLMRGAKDDPETALRVLQRMKSEVERMTRLINDLLTLARLDDTQPLKTQYVDLITLATEGLSQARKQANDERTISLIVEVSGPIGAQVDKERMKQLLFILLDNALKYGRAAPDGKIALLLDKKNEQAIIRVIDNGEGIAKEDLAHIFDSFYRGRHRRSSNGTSTIGVGLGLTIASAIIRAHSGTITVCSDASTGTEFRVTLPCVN